MHRVVIWVLVLLSPLQPNLMNSSQAMQVTPIGYYNRDSDTIPLQDERHANRLLYEQVGRVTRTRRVTLPDGRRGTELSSATGFKISPCLVLTAAHVVFFKDEAGARGLQVKYERYNEHGQARATKAVVEDFGAYRSTSLHGEDWALLKIDSCSEHWLPLVKEDQNLGGREVECTGFHWADRPSVLATDRAKQITEVAGPSAGVFVGTVASSCGLAEGASGSPLIANDFGAGAKWVAGLQVASFREGVIRDPKQKSVSLSVDLRKLTARLVPRIAADTAAYRDFVSSSPP